MPRELIRPSGTDRSRSLGWLGLAWIEYFVVHGPGDVQGQPVQHGDEYSSFTVDAYALDPRGRLLIDSGFLSRPKGCDKSGQGARYGLLEALGPCRFAGWAQGGEVYVDPWGLGFEYRYEPGEPMGRTVRVPYLRCMATEEGQTGHVYNAIYYNLTEGPLAQVPGVTVGVKKTVLPDGGEIVPSTAGAASKDGGKETWAVFDETHLYVTGELHAAYDMVTRNLRKRKKGAGTWYLETTTMFAAGEESVAEATYKLATAIREGRARRDRLLFDHRWGECEDLADEDELRAGLEDAYGDAAEYNDIEGLIDGFYDVRNDPVDQRRYFLNAKGSAADAWLVDHEWAAMADATKVVADGEMITLGFDGSRRRARGVTDATALVACRLSDGHVFEPLEQSVWEQPPNWPKDRDWTVPAADVDRAVDEIFRRYKVVGFFADPAKWETYVARWEAKYSAKLKVKASREHPIEWWFTGGRAHLIVQAVREFHDAVVDQHDDFSHDGSYALTRHVLNARRRMSRAGLQIAKENPESPKKIDAAIAGVLAVRARRAALSAGVHLQQTDTYVPKRIR